MPKAPKGKVYLQKRSFLTDDKSDTSVVIAEVRTYDYGGSEATFSITNPNRFGVASDDKSFNIYCSLYNEKDVKQTNQQIDNLITNLQEYKKAINAASKDVAKMNTENEPTKSR